MYSFMTFLGLCVAGLSFWTQWQHRTTRSHLIRYPAFLCLFNSSLRIQIENSSFLCCFKTCNHMHMPLPILSALYTFYISPFSFRVGWLESPEFICYILEYEKEKSKRNMFHSLKKKFILMFEWGNGQCEEANDQKWRVWTCAFVACDSGLELMCERIKDLLWGSLFTNCILSQSNYISISRCPVVPAYAVLK